MRNLISSGNTVQITAAGTYTAGTPVLIGQLFGIPATSAVSGELVTLHVRGIATLAKTSALAIAVGDALYWDAGNSLVNKTSSGQKEIGWAASDAANPSSTVDVYLVPTVRASMAA